MPSTFPGAPDDLTRSDLTHGDVADALAAVEATLGANPQGDEATVAARLAALGVEGAGPDEIEQAVWRIDGGDGPIVADAGSYRLGSNLFAFPMIDVGDDEAAVQAKFDAFFNEMFSLSTEYRRGTMYDATITGDWSSFTIALTLRGITLGMYLDTNALTLDGNPADWPTVTSVAGGHGTYVTLPGLHGRLIGRATTEGPFTGSTGMFIDPNSEHYSDGGFVKWTWESQGTTARGVSDLMGATTDRMDVQRQVHEDSISRWGQVNVQGYGDHGLAATRVHMRAEIARDGMTRHTYVRGESDDLSGIYDLSITQTTVQALFRVNPSQTEPVVVVQDVAGTPVFQITPDGSPVLTSPDGTAYRLVVADDGTLSTVPA